MGTPLSLEIKIFMILFVLLIVLTAVSLLVFKPGIYSCNDLYPEDAQKADECRMRNKIGIILLFPYAIPFFISSFLLYSIVGAFPALMTLDPAIGFGILAILTFGLTFLELWLVAMAIGFIIKRLNGNKMQAKMSGTYAKKYKNRR